MSLRNLITEQPVLSRMLRENRLFLPEGVHAWAVDYLEDVETLIRSRNFRVNFIANRLLARFLTALGV